MLLIACIHQIRKAQKKHQAQNNTQQSQNGQLYSTQGPPQNEQGQQVSYQSQAGASYANQGPGQYGQ